VEQETGIFHTVSQWFVSQLVTDAPYLEWQMLRECLPRSFWNRQAAFVVDYRWGDSMRLSETLPNVWRLIKN
jgi:hypothetical protein